MKLWSRLRGGAYFVDFLLLIAAVIAIIGLATFVRLHTAKSTDEVGLRSSMSLQAQRLDTLSFEGSTNGASTSPTDYTASTGVGSSATSASSSLQSAGTAPEASSSATACGLDCDSKPISIDPPTEEELEPIEVQPTENPPKSCNGLLKKAMSSIQSTSDSIACKL